MARETKGWAVFTPRGRLVNGTVLRTKGLAWDAGMIEDWTVNGVHPMYNEPAKMRAKGYTCRRVTVTAEGDDG